jgi:hypothetical protein
MSIPATAGRFEAGVDRLQADAPVNSKSAKTVVVFRSDMESPFPLFATKKKKNMTNEWIIGKLIHQHRQGIL